MIEQWRFIPGFQNKYLISDRGRVFSAVRKKVLQQNDPNAVILHMGGKPYTCSINNLVKGTFGIACNYCECEKASKCWRCGFNPKVAKERKQHLQERGLTEKPNGIKYFQILPEDYEGYRDFEED